MVVEGNETECKVVVEVESRRGGDLIKRIARDYFNSYEEEDSRLRLVQGGMKGESVCESRGWIFVM